MSKGWDIVRKKRKKRELDKFYRIRKHINELHRKGVNDTDVLDLHCRLNELSGNKKPHKREV